MFTVLVQELLFGGRGTQGFPTPVPKLSFSSMDFPKAHIHVHVHNSYLTVIGVHEMHGQVHPNYCQTTILLIVDPLSSWDYLMMTHPLYSNLPIKTLVARQLLQRDNVYTCEYY